MTNATDLTVANTIHDQLTGAKMSDDDLTQIDIHNQRHARQRGLGEIVESVVICRPSPELLKTFKCETW